MSETSERMPWQAKVALGALIVGAVLLCAGLARQPWSDDVDCGGSSMRPGDRCVSSRGSSATYEERREVRENGTAILIAGAVLTAGGLLTLNLLKRSGRPGMD